MKPGDRLEAALWFNPENPADKRKAVEGITRSIRLAAEKHDAGTGSIQWTEMEAVDARLPDPPKHLRGKPLKCLYGEADVLMVFARPKKRPFVEDLTEEDLGRLRKITRERWREGDHPSLDEIDDMIEYLGPEIAAREALN